MFERFTDQAHRAVVFAQEEARQLNHDHVGTEHVLAGLLREDRGAAAQVLEASGVTLDAVRERIEALAGHGQAPPRGHIPFTPRAKKGFELALREAVRLGRNIGTGHLLLGLIGQGDCVAVQVLGALGVDLQAFRARVVAETESRPEGLEYSLPADLAARADASPAHGHVRSGPGPARLDRRPAECDRAASRHGFRRPRKCHTPLVMCGP